MNGFYFHLFAVFFQKLLQILNAHRTALSHPRRGKSVFIDLHIQYTFFEKLFFFLRICNYFYVCVYIFCESVKSMNFAKLSINILTHIYSKHAVFVYSKCCCFQMQKRDKSDKKNKTRTNRPKRGYSKRIYEYIYKICNVDPMRIEEMKVRMFDTENKIENWCDTHDRIIWFEHIHTGNAVV